MDSSAANCTSRFLPTPELESAKVEQLHPLALELVTWLKLQNLRIFIWDTLAGLLTRINLKMCQSTTTPGNVLVSLHQAK